MEVLVLKAAAEAATTSPKTGDSMPIAVLIVFMFSAAGMLVFLDLKKRKKLGISFWIYFLCSVLFLSLNMITMEML